MEKKTTILNLAGNEPSKFIISNKRNAFYIKTYFPYIFLKNIFFSRLMQEDSILIDVYRSKPTIFIHFFR